MTKATPAARTRKTSTRDIRREFRSGGLRLISLGQNSYRLLLDLKDETPGAVYLALEVVRTHMDMWTGRSAQLVRRGQVKS